MRRFLRAYFLVELASDAAMVKWAGLPRKGDGSVQWRTLVDVIWLWPIAWIVWAFPRDRT